MFTLTEDFFFISAAGNFQVGTFFVYFNESSKDLFRTTSAFNLWDTVNNQQVLLDTRTAKSSFQEDLWAAFCLLN